MRHANRGARTRRPVATALLACIALALAGCSATNDTASIDPRLPRPSPLFGADMIYQDAPHVLIRAWRDDERGRALAAFLAGPAGLTSVRINSFGFYSFLGRERSLELRRETQQANKFPWFPIESAIAWVRASRLSIVAGVNPEDGPEAAVAFVERFREMGALDRLVAVEIGNEPHLSRRPWQPEEYAEAAAAIVRALEPYGVKCAISLTVGSESKTPTGISDDDYTRREIAALDRALGLAGRDDLYGVVHLYAGGVDPAAIERLSAIVHPIAPRMRYLVTEYNIRSRLADNAQLTAEYGVEFIAKTSRLVAHPDVAGLFVHGVPYHAIAYWVGDAGIQTVSGYHDPRLQGEARNPGWHLTPAGRFYGLLSRELWRGELVDYAVEGDVQLWRTRVAGGEERYGVVNASSSPFAREVEIGGATVLVETAPRSVAVDSKVGLVGAAGPF
jgi:hypothetical protein